MANRGKSKSLRAGHSSTTANSTASKAEPNDATMFSPDAVEKIMTGIETLGQKVDTQRAALHQDITSIRQELHTTAIVQNAKRVDDLEHSANEWSSLVMALEITVERLKSVLCNLKEKCLDLEGQSRRQNV